ncbi:MAG TPA: hypothetical protein PK566_18705 [Pseudobacteroides sp.]|nr:hypothetical protein [Pseudobacteroides sp.]
MNGIKLKLLLVFSIIVTFISVAISGYFYKQAGFREAQIKKQIDINFLNKLGMAQSSFGVDFLKQKNPTESNYFFYKCMSDVASAAASSALSSYEEHNDLLGTSLSELNKAMQNSPEKVKNSQQVIYDMLTKIMLNPNNTEATKKLHDYVGTLY